MSLIKKLLGETAIYGLGNMSSRLLFFVVLTPFLSVALGKNGYGEYSLMYVQSAILMVFFLHRMDTAFFRYATLKENNYRQVLFTSSFSVLLIASLLCLLTMALSQPLANFIGYGGKTYNFILFAMIIWFDALTAIPKAKLRLENKAKKFIIITAINILVTLFFVFLFLSWLPGDFQIKPFGPIAEDKVSYVFLSNWLASLCVFLVLLPEYFNVKKENNKRLDFTLLKRMYAYVLPLVVVGFSYVVNEMCDRIFQSKMLAGSALEIEAEIGIYSGVYKLAIFMTLFTQAFTFAAEPFFFKNAKRADAADIYGNIGLGFTIVGAFVFLMVNAYLDLFKLLLPKQEFWVGLYLVPILLMANLMLGIYMNIAVWYKLSGKTKIGAYIALVGVLVTVIGNYWLIPVLGTEGSAWTTLACYALMVVLAYWTGQKYYPINYPVKQMVFYIILSFFLYKGLSFAISILALDGLLKYIVATIALAIFIIIVILAERKRFASMIKV